MGSTSTTSLVQIIIIVFQMIMLLRRVEGQNTNFSFLHLSEGADSFMMVNDAHYYADWESFVMNERGTALYRESCGRVLYKERVRMKDTASGAVASFHTAFTFQIYGPEIYKGEKGWYHGDGLAFTFLRTTNITDEKSGYLFCLFKDIGGAASNRVFAVEFDTWENDNINDPSNQHIGVDVNGVESKWYYNFCGGSVKNCTYLWNGGYFTTWIDYDSASEKLEIFFSNGSLNLNNVSKPPKPLLNASVSLSDILDEFMYVGFSASTGIWGTELHEIQSWAFQSSGMPETVTNSSPNSTVRSNSSSRDVGIIAGVSVGAVVALLVVSLFIATWCWRRRRRISSKKEDKFGLVDRNLVPRAFSYKELCKGTKNFSRSELLGCGGFGSVYKGTLRSGALVAVKRMRHESKHGVESFQTEAASLSQIRHRNLVQLRGWCSEEEQLFLVYDFMCNGSLDEWLFTRRVKEEGEGEGERETPLSLSLRHSVLSGVAGALAYLHEECAQCVLHRDIKSSNVLLDGDLNAYLGDFGLARLIDHQKVEKTTMMAGTLGYMAPEMPHTGKATKESDVYSFGVLMLEVMCGARPLDMAAIERGNGILVDRVWQAHEAGKILHVADFALVAFPFFDSNAGLSDDALELQEVLIDASGATDEKQLVTNLLHLGLLCCNPNPEDRPSMRLVSQLLHSSKNMEVSMPALPVCKPHARYSRPGFSQLATIVPESSDSSALSNVVDVAAGEASSSHSSAPVSGPVSYVDPGNTQTSFVASSAISSGR